MTENIFFPLFLTTIWATVAALERPTVRRQLVVVELLALGLATRPQAVALVPALLTAIVLVSIGDDPPAGGARASAKRLLRSLRPFLTTFLLLAVVPRPSPSARLSGDAPCSRASETPRASGTCTTPLEESGAGSSTTSPSSTSIRASCRSQHS